MNTDEFITSLESYLINETDISSVANEQMIIPPETFDTVWYEDKDGKRIPMNSYGEPLYPEDRDKIVFQVTRFPLEIRTSYFKIVKQKDVDTCKHPEKYIVPTYGWVDGYEGRECKLCHGTQVKKITDPWPDKWDANGSRLVMSTACNTNAEDLIIAMVNSGDYRLSEAILVVSQACERCLNVLLHKYLNGKDGYPEYSEEWMKCNTLCRFCEHEKVGKPVEL